MSENNSSYHFIAIGGVGQSAIAKILAQKGYKVSGSDIKESKYTKMLEKLGVKVYIGHDEKNIKEGQTIVLSTAIKEDNPELQKAKALKLPILHRSDILKIISEEFDCFIGFSGTHGKTTTSGLCAYTLEKIGMKPAYASGGIISGLNTNANAYPDSKFFIAELDESDGTIIKYKPDIIVINNLESDHFDFYKNGEEDLIAKFEQFIKNLKPSAKVIINIDDKGNRALMEKSNYKNAITYSIKDKSAHYFAGDIQLTPEYNSFRIYRKGCFIGEIKTAIKGEHNVYNALAVAVVMIEKSINLSKLKESFSTFTGMQRRFETTYDKEIKIIDDYAHHPTEITATLKSAKKQTQSPIVAIFQPHRYTRLKALWNDFLNAFELADKLFVVDTYSAGDSFDEKFNSENFAKEIKHNCVKYIKGTMDDASKEISKCINKGDFIITIGAGDVTKISRTLGENYEKYRN